MLEFNGTGIIIAISFIIFVIIENFIFYAAMRKTLEDRADYIANNEKDAQIIFLGTKKDATYYREILSCISYCM